MKLLLARSAEEAARGCLGVVVDVVAMFASRSQVPPLHGGGCL